MLGASARSPAGRPCAWKIHDTKTLCESSFWTQVRDLQKLSKKVEQQEREPKRARKHSSPFDTLPSPAQCARPRCASPPTLPICTCAAPIEPACCGLQLDFASLQLGDEDDAWPLSADGIGTEGLRTGQKVLALHTSRRSTQGTRRSLARLLPSLRCRATLCRHHRRPQDPGGILPRGASRGQSQRRQERKNLERTRGKWTVT
jgi:hypothetical protein